MNEQCKNCEQRKSCQQTFKQLGSLKGPSILLKVIQAFLIPLILFIAGLTAAERLLAGKIARAPVKSFAALACGVAVVFLYLAIIKLFRRIRN